MDLQQLRIPCLGMKTFYSVAVPDKFLQSYVFGYVFIVLDPDIFLRELDKVFWIRIYFTVCWIRKSRYCTVCSVTVLVYWIQTGFYSVKYPDKEYGNLLHFMRNQFFVI